MLNKEQKSLLQWLVKHPAWSLVKELEEESLNDLWRSLLSVNITDEKQLEIIKNKQIYATARKDFIKSIENKTVDIFWSDIDLK